jgi:hypothetical protein
MKLLLCPDRDDLPEDAAAEIRHGEGAHSGHVLGYWDADAVRYVVSVHGTSAASRDLIERIVEDLDIVDGSS